MNLSSWNRIRLVGFVVLEMEVLSLGFMLLLLMTILLVLNELVLIVALVEISFNLDFFWLMLILNLGVLLNEPLVFSTFIKDLSIL